MKALRKLKNVPMDGEQWAVVAVLVVFGLLQLCFSLANGNMILTGVGLVMLGVAVTLYTLSFRRRALRLEATPERLRALSDRELELFGLLSVEPLNSRLIPSSWSDKVERSEMKQLAKSLFKAGLLLRRARDIGIEATYEQNVSARQAYKAEVARRAEEQRLAEEESLKVERPGRRSRSSSLAS